MFLLQGSSLISQLPEPKHAPIKEIKRSLVPHSLTKNKKPTKPLTPIPKSSPARPKFPTPPSRALPGVPEGDSEEEEEEGAGGNFFSLRGSGGKSSSSFSSSSANSNNSYMSRLASINSHSLDVKEPVKRRSLTETTIVEEDEMQAGPSNATRPAAGQTMISSAEDAPLSFKPGMSASSSRTSSSGGGGYGRQRGTVSASQMYNLANVEEEEEEEAQQVSYVILMSKKKYPMIMTS